MAYSNTTLTNSDYLAILIAGDPAIGDIVDIEHLGEHRGWEMNYYDRDTDELTLFDAETGLTANSDAIVVSHLDFVALTAESTEALAWNADITAQGRIRTGAWIDLTTPAGAAATITPALATPNLGMVVDVRGYDDLRAVIDNRGGALTAAITVEAGV